MSRPKVENIQHITSKTLTKPLPVYTHATIHKGIAYISGIQGFVPGTFDLSKDIREEARQAFHNLKVILEEVGSSVHHVLKITILMSNMRDFEQINDAENEVFPESAPARSSIAVKELPHDARVAVEAVAALVD
jgi:2-iminobutanoate/2-iminopropanoate deaminase